jgi:hypothetical protein
VFPIFVLQNILAVVADFVVYIRYLSDFPIDDSSGFQFNYRAPGIIYTARYQITVFIIYIIYRSIFPKTFPALKAALEIQRT